MKKILAIISILVILAMASTGIYLFAVKKNERAIKNISVQTENAPRLQSFRGCLADILVEAVEEAQEIKNEIAEAVPNPLSGNKETAYPDDSENSFTFAILGDTQRFSPSPSGNFQKAIVQIAKLNPDIIFAVGDLLGSCDGSSKCVREYTDWKNIVGSLIPKTYAMQGNHDRTGGDKTDNVWRDSFNFPTNGPSGFSEQVYCFDFKNSHFVVLDSDKPKEHLVNGEQRSWLEKDLATNKKENTFVFFHEPAYPVSSKTTESLDKEPSERNALWQILEKYNVTAVFNGHEHIVSRRKIGSLYQFVFGSTDSFNHNLPAPGIAEYANQGQGRFGIAKVKGEEITIETHSSDGTTLNSFTFSK